MAGEYIGLEIVFEGEGLEEKGYIAAVDEPVFNARIGEKYLSGILAKMNGHTAIVAVDAQYFRPTEVDFLLGDPGNKVDIRWTPEYDLPLLVAEMMENDILLVRKDDYLNQGGFKIKNYFD